MEADVPPLDKIHRLKKDYKFILYCDEAHSLLSLGKTGQGCLEYWNDKHPHSPLPWNLIDIRTGTLSKAVGGIGGVIAGKGVFEETIRKYISNLDEKENVSLPSSTMVQTLWLLGQPSRIDRNLQRLAEISHFCREELGRFGIFVYGDIGTPVLPVYAGRPSVAARLSYALRRGGLLATPVCTPAVPFWESRVRINLSADFTDDDVNRLVETVIRASTSVGLCKTAGIVKTFSKADVCSFASEADPNEASRTFDRIQNLIRMDAARCANSHQQQLFKKTCGPPVVQAGHVARAQYGIGAGGARWICGTFPPHLEVESLVARATGMEAGLTYADASIGLASTIAALSRPLLGHSTHYMLFERGVSQFVRDGLMMAPKKDAPVLLGYIDLFQLVHHVRKLAQSHERLCLTVYVRVGEDLQHSFLSSTLEGIATLMSPESVMTILLHCTSQSLNLRELISVPSRENIHVLMSGSFNRIFGLPSGFLTGPESLIRELRYTSRAYMFTTSQPPFVMDMLRAALQ
ncbi:aminotransferase fum8 [Colletotrichum spaethianum]|uniref:serine C-palmitoyltransferase n=1 Tax=Colletotrichum spaethianum TaxID=700344 RepID=A0AA37L3F0_9PEZI|nr:aminotransferase fum8 [Colletotrichum spaethianum]GKT41233.1 aminotransferase fum8 [Colletotrichum spaethianum]